MTNASLFPADQLVEEQLSNRSSDPADFEISNDQIAAEAISLQLTELSGDLETWVDDYELIGDRDPYLWTWCQQGVQLTTLPCVLAERRSEVRDTKVLGVMLDVLIDDVADKGGDQQLLEHLMRLPTLNPTSDWCASDQQEKAYVEFTESVWNEVDRRVRLFPRYDELAEVLRYDYWQLMNAMRYSHLLNRLPSLLNLAEHDLYLPHNMHMMISATMDLMCSPSFDMQEIGRLREAICHAQYMGRVGNLITTWQREIGEGDFTSGVFARAVVYGDISLDELEHGDRAHIEDVIRQGGHEQYFLQQWQHHRKDIIRLRNSIQSIDLFPLIRGLERLICLHLASRGFK